MAKSLEKLTSYTNILVPTDGSGPAWEVSKHAVYLAKQCGASLHAIYVVEGGKAFKTGIHYHKTVGEMITDGKKAVKKIKKLAESTGVKCTTSILEGDVAKTIMEYALENRYDLIVIGLVDMGTLEKVFIGSVTPKVVERAHCSVHVVRPYHR